jgi:GNAT superfamily N-acetyltransferase
LGQFQRAEDPQPWEQEAESFLLDGRAMWHLRNPATVMLAVAESVGDRFTLEVGADNAVREEAFLGVAIAYPDPVYQQTMRLGSMCVDVRFRGAGVGVALFTALLVEALRREPYAIWLVHSANKPMLRLCRQSKLAADEAEAADGYIQFFAERQ